MTPQPAQHAGEEENILIRGHDGDWSGLSRADCPYMPVDLRCRTWVSTSPRDTNGLNDELKLASGFAHVISYISEAVGLGKKMES